MSKRFIDTGLFDDGWFMDLSKDAKLLWVYLITKCDHAGIIKINEKLCKLQTDIKDLNVTIKQLGNRLVTVSEHLYFIPKFIEFQYPGFPNSKVRQQSSALEILNKYGLIEEGKLTVSKELPNSYDNDNVNDIVIDNDNVLKKREEKFIKETFEFEQQYSKEMLDKFCNYWTEPNKSNTKMRFELEAVFDIARRLATWHSRDKSNQKSKTSDIDPYIAKKYSGWNL